MTESSSTVAAGQLRTIIERIERMEQEKSECAEVIKEIYAEVKAHGFDSQTVRKVVALRRQDPTARQEAEAMLNFYCVALGMVGE